MSSPKAVVDGLTPSSVDEFVASRRRLVFRPPTSKPQIASDKVSLKLDDGNSAADRDIGSPVTIKYPMASTSAAESEQKRRVSTWNQAESMGFYEALKQNGKDFDAISKHLLRKKVHRDKEQVRNYYFNVFKTWLKKAQIEEHEWENVPQIAREMFIILNGCEWRKRLNGADIEPAKFRTLIFEGSVTFRNKRKKTEKSEKSSFMTIRTPYCPALYKFFPCDRRNNDIPQHVALKFLPYRYQDRHYVSGAEQNPYLQLQANINDKISSVFTFLSRKWRTRISKTLEANSFPAAKLRIRLRISDAMKVYKVHMEVNEDSGSLLCLKRLKRGYDCDSQTGAGDRLENTNTSTNGADSASTIPTIPTPMQSSSDVIRLNSSSFKKVFVEIEEEMIRTGFTEDDLGKASLLQLFYLLGMKRTINLNYEILGTDADELQLERPWLSFMSLVNREYDDLMAKSTAYLDKTTTAAGTAAVACIDQQQVEQQRPLTPQNQAQNNIINMEEQEDEEEVEEEEEEQQEQDQSHFFESNRAEELIESMETTEVIDSPIPASTAIASTEAIAASAGDAAMIVDDDEAAFLVQLNSITQNQKRKRPPSKRQSKPVDISASLENKTKRMPPPTFTLPRTKVNPPISMADTQIPAAVQQKLQPMQQTLYYIVDDVANQLILPSATTLNNADQQQQPVAYIITTPSSAITTNDSTSITLPYTACPILSGAALSNSAIDGNLLLEPSSSAPQNSLCSTLPTDFSHLIAAMPLTQQRQSQSYFTLTTSTAAATTSTISAAYPENDAIDTKPIGRRYNNLTKQPLESSQRCSDDFLGQQHPTTAAHAHDFICLDTAAYLTPPHHSSSLLHLECSPSKSLTTPDTLINHAVHEMINQNSQDFCQHFNALTKMTRKEDSGL